VIAAEYGMVVNELKADAATGKISFARLIFVIVVQQKRIEQIEAQSLSEKSRRETQ
jgi:hypothetical protein